MSFIKSLKDKISASLPDHLGKVSSSTISSYFILSNILISSMVYMVIEVVNAVTMWETGHVYTVPLEHIGIFSLLLTHHLVLLGIKAAGNKSLFPNITKTIEEKHYTGVNISKTTDVTKDEECEDEELVDEVKPVKKKNVFEEDEEDSEETPVCAKVEEDEEEDEVVVKSKNKRK